MRSSTAHYASRPVAAVVPKLSPGDVSVQDTVKSVNSNAIRSQQGGAGLAFHNVSILDIGRLVVIFPPGQALLTQGGNCT